MKFNKLINTILKLNPHSHADFNEKWYLIGTMVGLLAGIMVGYLIFM